MKEGKGAKIVVHIKMLAQMSRPKAEFFIFVTFDLH